MFLRCSVVGTAAVVHAYAESGCTLHGLYGLPSCMHVLSAYVHCMVRVACCYACMHQVPMHAARSIHPAVMQQTLHTLKSAHHLLTADQV